ncbi:hypothetical protein B0H13DRAFT_1864173 [Mycena leptocephala]|nr:hypothetical protein B0H13DRAFT_1864173 [Mycena leptocephala]
MSMLSGFVNGVDQSFKVQRILGALLRNGVVPVEKYAHLPALEISPKVGVCVIKSCSEIDTAMRTILQDVPDDSDNDPRKIIIFLDSEWNVEISDRGYLTGRGQTVILQIGYKNMIYIIQLGAMLAGGQISTILTQILQNGRVLNVGRAVSGDLKYLERAIHPSKPFVGAVDLAKMAKDRLVVANADLCAVTLGISAWENEDLSPSRIRYAALDVHACSRIYDFLSTIPIPALLPKVVEIGTKVLVSNDDRTGLIARGSIEHLDGSFQTGKVLRDGTMDTINISSSRCLVPISEVVVPAAILKTHKQTLSTFGSVPFSAGQQQNPPRTWEDLVRKSSDWVWRRCKRIIPPPEQLHGDVAEVFRTFGPLKDATTGLPLFNSAAWAVAKNILELISKGYLSDPPGIAFYYQLDACGEQKILKVEFTPIYALAFRLPVLRSDMPMLVSKISFCGTIFWYRYFLLVMNVETDAFQVGTFNSTGQRFKGHYSIWLTNEIQEPLSSPILLTGWVNGNLYEQMKDPVCFLFQQIFVANPEWRSLNLPCTQNNDIVTLLLHRAPESLFFQFTAQQKRNYSVI